MIQPLVTGERGCAGVVTFSDRVEWLQECTSDGEKLAGAFEKVRAGAEKGGRMLDAADQAIERLRRRTDSRRVLLLIAETRDRGSESPLSRTVVAAQTAGVTVYAATYSAYTTAFTARADTEPQMKRRPDRPGEETGTITGGAPRCGPSGCPAPQLPPPEQRFDILGGFGELVRLGRVKDTQVLAQMTGGATFPFTRLKGLERAIERLGAELHSQYLLSFTPEESSVGYRRLEVRVAGGPYRVRARPGYWAAQVSGVPQGAR
jgi:VWFA-related protein